MNKADIINTISEELREREISRKEVEMVINLFLSEIEKGLSKREEVKISTFGTFKVKTRKSRIGTSPVDGEKISIPASTSVGFKPSKNLKNSLK